MDEKFSFENLRVYEISLEFTDKFYSVTKNFPKEEIYALTSQFRRAAYSIALNIGEGSGGTKKEFISFLRIARRSVNECVVCISIASRQAYITNEIKFDLRQNLSTLSKMIAGLIKSIEDQKQ